MKQFIKTSLIAAALALSSVANAGIITVDGTGSNSTIVDNTHPYTVFFDLATKGYVKLVDSVTAATVQFTFKDNGPDNANNANLESFSITFGADVLGSSGGIINIPNPGGNFGPFSITGMSLSSLNANGTLQLMVNAGNGSFQFVSSTLSATVQQGAVNPGAVPEPLSIALLGIGLAGLAASRRKV